MHKNRQRKSNIELLRIISMFMILCLHFTGSTFNLPQYMTLGDLTNIATTSKVLMESFAIIGVNCFVLISGYFGINPKAKGIINYILWCAFYSVIIYSVYAIIYPKLYGVHDIFSSFGIFSHTDLWFVPAYFALYLLSPIINSGLKDISKRKFHYILLALVFLNVYLGWFWHGKINPTGYNLMQLVFIYIIGKYLRQFASTSTRCRRIYVIVYTISLLLIFTSSFYCPTNMTFAYNSPFVVMASVSFFLIFTTIHFRNKHVNEIAASSFAVYLIHKMPPIWSNLRSFLIESTKGINEPTFALYWIVFVLLIFTTCITIDKIRLKLMTPVVRFIYRQACRMKHFI